MYQCLPLPQYTTHVFQLLYALNDAHITGSPADTLEGTGLSMSAPNTHAQNTGVSMSPQTTQYVFDL